VGTEISLNVGGIAVDWAKNAIGIHHGPLFQEQDRQRLHCDQVNYDYLTEHGEDASEPEMSFSRLVKGVVARLEMLGVGLQNVRSAYDAAAKEWVELHEMLAESSTSGEAEPEVAQPMSFDEFVAFVRAHPLNELHGQADWSAERRGRLGRFNDCADVDRIPFDSGLESMAYSERSYFLTVIGFLGPYATIRLLAESPANLDLPVVWQYGPLVWNGWATAEQFPAGPSRRQTTLVATEGSSDVHILRHALKLLRPDVADFVRFIDVSDRHPFSGTGSLANFAEGLAKIDVHNQVVFVFDNDAEGIDAAARVSRLKLPPNMGVLVLPDLEDFKRFPASGPNGLADSDINGRAAAIECYLDLRLAGRPPAEVQWTSFKRDPDVYQGVLKHKGSYMDDFLKQTEQSLTDGGYDTSKIERVLDALIAECCRLAQAVGDGRPMAAHD